MENNNGEIQDNMEEQSEQKQTKINMVWSRVKIVFNKIYSVCKSLGGLIFLLVIYNVLGALLFQSIEYEKELEVKQVMNNTRQAYLIKFHQEIRNCWVGKAAYNATWFKITNELLLKYAEEVRSLGPIAAPQTVWSFWSALFFCGTIYTTIGYGNIVPLTGIGKFLAMVYAVLGIPLALLVLAEVGRRFTVLLKIIYGAVRRYYYTGTLQKKLVKSVRKRLSRRKPNIDHVENGSIDSEIKPSSRQKSKSLESIIFVKRAELGTTPHSSLKSKSESVDSLDMSRDYESTVSSTEKVKVLYDIEIDDSFNLPISIACLILIIYIFLGAIMYLMWEDWNFLDAFYFVFISLSTIGFGDITPEHNNYFIVSSIYMFMGLALVSMCVNVGIEFFTQTLDKAKAHMEVAKAKVVGVGKEKMSMVGKEMNKAKDKVSKAGTSAKDKISGVKKNIEINIQNELKRAKKHSLDSDESRSKENTPTKV